MLVSILIFIQESQSITWRRACPLPFTVPGYCPFNELEVQVRGHSTICQSSTGSNDISQWCFELYGLFISFTQSLNSFIFSIVTPMIFWYLSHATFSNHDKIAPSVPKRPGRQALVWSRPPAKNKAAGQPHRQVSQPRKKSLKPSPPVKPPSPQQRACRSTAQLPGTVWRLAAGTAYELIMDDRELSCGGFLRLRL